jgi:hypothetical protein
MMKEKSMKQNRTMSADHHLSHLTIEEGNIVVTKQELARQTKLLYLMKDRNYDPEEIEAQEYVVKNTELVLTRLEQAYSSTIS